MVAWGLQVAASKMRLSRITIKGIYGGQGEGETEE